MVKNNRNNKAFQSNANRPHADNTSNIVNKFGGSDPVQKGQDPVQRKGYRSPKRDPSWTSLNIYMRQGPCTEEVGPCKRKWAKPCTGEGRPGPCTGTPCGETHTQTHTT